MSQNPIWKKAKKIFGFSILACFFVEFLLCMSALNFADQLTESLIVQLVHALGDNGIKVTDKDFVKDLAFIIEGIKSAIYRDLDIKHDMQPLMDKFMITSTKNGKTNTMFNMELIPEFLEKTKK